MKIVCEKCGATIVVGGLGRKKSLATVEIVFDALARHTTVTAVAQELHCSRGHIYDLLREHGKKSKQLLIVPVKRSRKKGRRKTV
jgi:AraC-like DNA-binding protein